MHDLYTFRRVRIVLQYNMITTISLAGKKGIAQAIDSFEKRP